ncbi:MAG TPA: hypothetical protein VEX39_10030 [Thermoleophilaceae bacterium]|nr:hypothetical protein [Thermoleophilaceae bacterium]
MPHRSVPTLGVTLGLALVALSASPASAADSLFWANTNSDTVARADLAGGGGVTLSISTPIVGMFGLTANVRTGKLYWTDRGTNSITTANLDGSNSATLNTTGAPTGTPQGIAVDPLGGRVYWGTEPTSPVGYAALDGSGGGPFNTTGGAGSQGLTPLIDRARGRILWSTFTGIAYANLDGSGGVTQLDLGGAPADTIVGLAISGTKVYWVNEQSGTVAYANVDGSGAGGTLDTTGASIGAAAGLSIDAEAGRMYVGGGSANAISWVNLDGSGGGVQDTSGAGTNGARFPILVKQPRGTGAPVVTGARTLACSRGEWAGDLLEASLYRAPASYAFQWTRDGADLAGATNGSYAPAGPGSYGCRVSAANYAGDAQQTSADVAVGDPPAVPRPQPPAPAPARDTIAPVLSEIGFAPAGFAVASRASASAKGGTTIHFTLSEAATVVSVVQQKARGRWRPIRIFGKRFPAGWNTVRFSGRVRPRGRTRSLKPGRYRMRLRPSDPAGNRGRLTVRRFRIVR